MKKTIIVVLFLAGLCSCTKLDQKLYSVVSQNEFWQTPAQIAAGVAPAYVQLTNIAMGNNNVFPMMEGSSDEFIVPSRGNDWADAGHWDALWKHTWAPTGNFLDPAWQDIFTGISKCNFILSTVNSLNPAPSSLASINAEVRTLRAFYYYYAMDLWGNVPIVSSAHINPDSLTNSPRAQVFSFIESELLASLPHLSGTVDATTYGKVTKYFSYALLARLYLNAQVFSGTVRWTDCIKYCDSVLAGPYTLQPDYFDNFSPTNDGSVENIFVVPFDKTNISGNSWELFTLHYQSQVTFGLTTSPYNGFCSTSDFYANFDTTSTYSANGANTYRTFNDMRSGQYLVGQQFTTQYPYPPYQNVLYASTNTSIESVDQQTGLSLAFNPVMTTFSSGDGAFRLAGARNIKYFPQSGTGGNQSNDIVLIRLADVMLMSAEAQLRAGAVTNALSLVNKVRERAYSGSVAHDWTAAQLTLPNILAERARELAWEMVRRDDLIRYEVAGGPAYYSEARTPDKAADASDGHLYIYPIPQLEIIANAQLKQNPGY
ncbi:RagB/SusD family nutrient uptake outer membrane protein [Dinghuibacter silviterrae]|uniref:Putative outer membrane starch-binding protein n=1 Tax=Dinghuibacter silviterrae TaxID=1539049 RepID=A0A4R8DR01_9BACT|nr:RagB/SusD family nutrient uptake outer membrane protein [Dinghuibacter silviterrae]TDW99756.1 putative outer membrane starch-binding protein [Dinghuibacter silviterrae]